MQITLSLTDIVNSVQVPDKVTSDGDVTTMIFSAETDKAIPLARKLCRELAKFRVADYTGDRNGKGITLRFGIPGATPPANWTASRVSKSEKPVLLAELQKTLKDIGFESSYYNSGSVTQKEGIVISDSQVPVGLQFSLDDDGVLVARTMRGNGKWQEVLIDGIADAIRIVRNCTRIFDLS
jgi:hypothetical protein